MKFYDVPGHDRPLRLSEDHAELIGATEHALPTDPPARNATRAQWSDYAVSRGLDPEVAEGHTRGQLIELYGD